MGGAEHETLDPRLREALARAPAVLFEQDLELRYTWIHNPHPALSAQTVLGKTDFELLPRVEAEQLARIKRGVIATGVAARERVATTLDGEQHHYDLLVEPRRGADGAVNGVICASWDITAHVRLEGALRASEERFRALADSMPQLVWVASADGTVEYYNARAREYAGIEQLPDGTWRWQPLLHPDDLAATERTWRTALGTRTTYTCEHRVRMADGSLRWHISRARLVPDEHGERWFGTATDIHDQKCVAEDLARALATRDQVVSVVSHDLRGPLGVVSIAVPVLRTLIASHPDRDARRRADECLARVERQVTKMEKLLGELLDAAQLQAGQPLELARRPCDLVALARELVDEHAVAGTRIELRVPAHQVIGDWDAARLERVLGNLLSNAVKYSPRDRAIAVEVLPAGDDAIVRVIDRGVGIPAPDRERIFEWFARGANAERTARGIGIGLAGARRIIEQHGGTLTVDSELGAGSTFTVRIPLRRR